MYKDTSIVGKGVPLREGYPKVTGMERFVPDRYLAGALWMKILRSPHAHARMASIDVSAAESLPGVGAVLTYRDAPPNDILCAMYNWKGKVLENRVRFVGDEVAAVAAGDEGIAAEALSLIRVEYEQLEAVFDMEQAMKPGAPDVRGAGTNVVVTPPEPGTFQSQQGWGDVDAGFKQSDAHIECEVKTQSIYSGFFPPACIAEWDGDKLTLTISHQCPFEIKSVLCKALDIPEQKVRIIAPLVAGTFGMLNSAHRFWHIAALLSRKAGRPVIYKMTLDEYGVYKRRESDMLRVRMAGTKEGKITALDYEQLHDNGAYGFKSTAYGTMHDIFPRASVRFSDTGVSTNKFSSGCVRGVGDVPQALAINHAVDMLAEKLGIDPITIWKKNHTRAGDPRRAMPFSDMTLSSEGYDELIDKGAAAIGWEKKWQGWGKPYQTEGPRRRGVGMAAGLHVSGIPFLPTGAYVKLNHDGTALVSIGFTELGTGSKTTFAQICAEVLGLALEDVYVVKDIDTDVVPYAPMTGASTALHVGGSAVKVAALDARAQVLALARTASWSPEWLRTGAKGPQDLELKNGFIFLRSNTEKRVPVAEIISPPFAPQITGRAARQDLPFPGPAAYITMVVFADVEVDMDTGKVEVLKLVAGHDSGRIINPDICENQVYGGTLQSFGYALTEEVAFDPACGKPLNSALSDYWWPTSMDTPPMQVIFSENIDPVGPVGAKGLGEAPAVCPHAAIASAVYNAIGVRINELPMTPDKVLAATGRIRC